MESKVKTLTISQSDLTSFFVPENRRKIRQSLVGEIKQALKEGESYRGVIAVNKRGEKYRIIDGQHRFTAIHQFIEESEEAEEVKGHFLIYQNLTDLAESEEYDILQRRASENLNDYIQMHRDEIPVLSKLKKSFPIEVSAYAKKDAISYASLLKVWLNKDKVEPDAKRRDEFVEWAKELKDTDYFQMVSFFNKFKQIFGLPAKGNPYYKPAPLWGLVSIYWVNSGVIPEAKLLEMFRIRAIGDNYLIQMSKYYAKDAAVDTRKYLLGKFNRGNRGTRFL